VEAFLSRQTDSQLRSYVLGYGAILKEDLGDTEGARNSLVLARSLIGSSRLMFTHELGLAKLSQQQHLTEEARSWYRCALRTCLEIGDTSCAGALMGFLTSSLEPPSAEDASLCMQAALLSWRVLAMPRRTGPCGFTRGRKRATSKRGKRKIAWLSAFTPQPVIATVCSRSCLQQSCAMSVTELCHVSRPEVWQFLRVRHVVASTCPRLQASLRRR